IFSQRPAYAFFTLAHEGIPGHLMQHATLKNSSLPNIRKLINYSSYSEGWATYVERYIGKYTPLDTNVLDAYQLYDELSYLYLGMADIGINYFGWSRMEFKSFINQIFNLNDLQSDELYFQLIEVATNYLEYYFSYHQLLDLKAEFILAAQNKKIDKLDYEFHNFYLQSGPAPFYILKEEISTYLNNEN
ncbi:MAG: DUF885 family protein, partial [Bacilli bacterium]|nr:DUF885 family protein [Bacilli bacterium]